MYGDGNSQIIEILPPRLAGTNKTYTLQVALDGENFLDSPSVKLTVLNKSIENETDFVPCNKEDIKAITTKYVDKKTGKEIAEAKVDKGYIISTYDQFKIGPKEIEGYKFISGPNMADYDGEFVYAHNKYEFVFEYEKIDDPANPDPENPNPENPDPENPDPENPNPENPNPENPDPEKPGQGNQDQQNGSGTGNGNTTPKTGDTAPILPFAAAMIVSIGGMVFVFRKRKFIER